MTPEQYRANRFAEMSDDDLRVALDAAADERDAWQMRITEIRAEQSRRQEAEIAELRKAVGR